MRAFITKTGFLLTISFCGYLLIIFAVPKCKRHLDEIPKNYKAHFQSADIIICGDSRADNNLDPAIIQDSTKLKTVNIAKGAWDLYAMSKALREVKIKNK